MSRTGTRCDGPSLPQASPGMEKNRMARACPHFACGSESHRAGGVLVSRWLAVFLIGAAACAQANDASGPGTGTLCSDAWYRSMEERVPTSDGQGHGPDVGSDEWKSVIEFRLGIRGKPGLPTHDSEAWCRHIDRIVRKGRATMAPDTAPRTAASLPGGLFAARPGRRGAALTMSLSRY